MFSEIDARIKAVFDCNVFLQGLINAESPSKQCLRLWQDQRVLLYTARPILVEIRATLLRRELQEKFQALTYDRVATLLQALQRESILIEAVPTHFRYERDIKDEPYLNLAIAIGADYLVTRDNDMLDLMHRDDAVSVSFRARYPGIQIVNPVEFLNKVPVTEHTDLK